MHEWYERTTLTPLRVARATGYIDWSMQPSSFKKYPDGLFSYALNEHEALKSVSLARCVTSHHSVGGKPYLRLNTPSAGNLHPLELYVQIRAFKGIISGIYHIDARNERLVLIREIEKDGLEPALGMNGRFAGMIFILSCVPFRSVWKYGERAWRYCFLDAGHQLGALQTAAYACERELTIMSDFDAECLDALMGFETQEHCIAAALSGYESNARCEPIKRPLMQVQPTDYFECGDAVERIRKSRIVNNIPLAESMPSADHDLAALIRSRRSARRFSPEPVSCHDLERLMHLAFQPPQPLVCHAVVLRGKVPVPGLYEKGRLVREGVFANEVATLLADQTFVASSSIVLIISAAAFGAEALTAAGAFAHTLHLHAHANRLGFSGVGAFYDLKLQRFLNSGNCILYALAIGNDPQLKRDTL